MNKIKAVIGTIFIIGLLGSPAAQALEELSANVGVVSNYYFRGLSETDGAAAVQGGLDFEHDSGFYVGTWTSNIDYGDGTSYELDLYFGVGDEFDNGVSYDVGYIYYAYPDSPDSIDFGEIYGELGYSFFTFGAALVVNDSSLSALKSDDVYLHAGIEVPFQERYSAGLLIGQTVFDAADAEEYTHLSANLSRSSEQIGAFSFNLEYEDTFEKDLKVWVGWSLDFS